MSEIDDDDPFARSVSLFRSLEEKGKYLGRTNILQSVIMVGRISPHITEHQMIAKYFESLLLHYKPPDQITGLLLVYPYHVINIIETSFRTLMEILRSLNESEKIIDCYIQSYTTLINKDLAEDEPPKKFTGFDKIAKQEICERHNLAPIIHNRILSNTDNVIHRIFRTYEVLIFDMEPSTISDYDTNESDEKSLKDMLNQMTRLSVYLAEEPMKNQEDYVPELFKLKLTEILRTIRETHPEMVPQQVTVGYFADKSTYEGIIPLQEYLNIFDVPYEISLQSELTWPIQRNSFFYT